jgi:hypothetical protein
MLLRAPRFRVDVPQLCMQRLDFVKERFGKGTQYSRRSGPPLEETSRKGAHAQHAGTELLEHAEHPHRRRRLKP